MLKAGPTYEEVDPRTLVNPVFEDPQLNASCVGCGAKMYEYGEEDPMNGVWVCTRCAVVNRVHPSRYLPTFKRLEEVSPMQDFREAYLESQTSFLQARTTLVTNIKDVVYRIGCLRDAPGIRKSIVKRALDVVMALIDARDRERKALSEKNPYNISQKQNKRLLKEWKNRMNQANTPDKSDAIMDETGRFVRPLPPPPRVYDMKKVLAFPKDNTVIACACVFFAIEDVACEIGVIDIELMSVLIPDDMKKRKKVNQFLKKIQVRVGRNLGKADSLMRRHMAAVEALANRIHLPIQIIHRAKDIAYKMIREVFLGGKSPVNNTATSIILACEEANIELESRKLDFICSILGLKKKTVTDSVLAAKRRFALDPQCTMPPPPEPKRRKRKRKRVVYKEEEESDN